MRRKKEQIGLFDWLLLAFALSLAAIVLYYSVERWPSRAGTAVPPSTSPPSPSNYVRAGSVAAARAPEPEGVSRSFQAVGSIPPLEISRTGRPSVRSKAPPAPKSKQP